MVAGRSARPTEGPGIQALHMADEAPVLIAGGGLVGLSAAAFLARQGIPSLVIERLPTSSPLPRAAFFHMRTLEMFREIGIEEAVRSQSAQEFVPEGAIIAMDALAGRKLADIIPNLNEGVDALSPCRRLFLNQPTLEPILRDCARAGGAAIVQGAEIVEVRQGSAGVSLTIRRMSDGSTQEARGDYLIAADGAHSKVRTALGIDYEGRGTFSNSLTIYFTADLFPYVGDNAWSLIYVNNPTLRGFFRLNRAATAGFLGVNVVGDPALHPDAAMNSAADLSESRLIELVRAGVGKSDLAVRIDGYSRWRATASVAQRLREGRVFIAGDAAHLMPPNGGFGGNTGIHDVHNLAWKLALVIKGQAGAGLLDTYETERRPVAVFTAEQAFSRYVARTAPWLAARAQAEPLVEDFDIELGYLYDSPAGVHDDPRVTRGAPGSRAPHLWLGRRDERISTIDLAGRYVLLAGAAGAAWVDAAKEVAQAFALTLDAYCIGRELADLEQRFPAAFGISDSGAALVRPDGFVAWNCPQLVAEPATALRRALSASLFRSEDLRAR
jgi:2-polyprenyl-6-methoxyphenol hydroxylase-like FAD-dependent oxidoreductase